MVVRANSRGIYYTWSAPGTDNWQGNMPLAKWGTARNTKINDDGTWTRHVETLAETTWRIVNV